MTTVSDPGEPISAGRVDRRKLEAEALRNVLFFVALFGGCVLINGLLAILLIGWLQSIGVWEVSAPESVLAPASQLATRLWLGAEA